ncbi:MAG: hypothetical protein WCO44_10565 [Bacteroidota bacterium]
MNTNLLQRTISRAFPGELAARATEVIFLFSVGIVAVLLHSKLRFPMHLPGKQGLLFVALVITSRGLSRWPFATSIACLGSATLLLMPGLGFHDPFMAVNYILMGGLMDVVFTQASRITPRIWIITGATGLCWVLIPLFRLAVSPFAVVPMGAFSSGIAFPIMTHLAFGLAGGLLSAGLLGLLNKGSR